MLLEYFNGYMTPSYILIPIPVSRLIVAIFAQRVMPYPSLLDRSLSLKRTFSAALQPISHAVGYGPFLVEGFFVGQMLFTQ